MKEGKVIFIDNIESLGNIDFEKLKSSYSEKDIYVEFAVENKILGFYSIPEAILNLVQRGVKRVSAFPFSLGESYEVPLYWGTY